jgi:tRNA threonylcarbamoyladenosine biosynthesis protein TsaE
VPANNDFQRLEKRVYFFPMIGTTTVTKSPAETKRLAASLAASLKPGAVIALHGDLGAGKTCFAQGLAEALGIQRPVSSPTFTLISEYQGRLKLNHIDLYRIHNVQEALNLGIDEYLHGEGVTVIEWAERIAPILPEHTIHIRMETGAEPNERIIAA